MAERLGPFSVPPQPAVGHLCECRGGLRPEPAVGVSLRVPRRSAAGASVKRPLLRSGGFPAQPFLRSGGFPARLFSAVRRLSRAALFCGPEAFLHGPFLQSGRPVTSAPASRPRIAAAPRPPAPVCGSRLRLPSAAPAFRPRPTAPASRGRCSDGPAAGCAGRAARTRRAAAPAPRPAGRDTAR